MDVPRLLVVSIIMAIDHALPLINVLSHRHALSAQGSDGGGENHLVTPECMIYEFSLQLSPHRGGQHVNNEL